jgi:hypothetical protein
LYNMPMHLVAVYKLPEYSEALAKALAGALGKTVYEAAMRLRASKDGPLVVAVCGERAQADELRGKLQEAGFHVIILAEDEVEARFVVRRPAFGEQGLRVESRQEQGTVVPYGSLRLILRATGITTSTETETETERKLSLGQAVLTSGLKVTKTEKTTREKTVEKRESFFHLYTGSPPVFVFPESDLLFDSLGPALQPTRAANFAFVIAELRRRHPGLPYDDRLMNRLAQVQLLGPQLSPELHLPLALSLLARSLLL